MGLFDSIKKAAGGAVSAVNPFDDKGGPGDPQGIYKNNGMLRVGKAEKLQLAADQQRLQQDPTSFGLSDAEKEKRAAEATDTASKQAQSTAGDLAQAALAGQGFQAGAFEQAQRNLGEGTADAAVEARTGINDLSSRMIEAAKQDISNRIHAERMSKKQEAQFWAKFGVDSTANLVSAAGSVAGG